MLTIAGLCEIIDRYEAVATDQYGVLHDGETVFTQAHDVLCRLAERGLPVVTLTNSGKRAATNAQRLARMGLPEELVGTVISSGELARHHLEQLPPGTSVALITRDGETELIDGLDLLPVEVTSDTIAERIVLAGIRPESTSWETYCSMLAPYAEARVPMLLVNPDTLMGQGSKTYFGAGAVAQEYARGGGPVTTLGKPAPAMFDEALKALGGPEPDKVLMIGDSPEHDIGGARRAGLATLLIRGGVQSGVQGVSADFAMEHLCWSAN